MSANPYAGYEEKASPDQLALLQRLVDQLAAEETQVERIELELKAAQERARKLREHDIPDLMRSVGLKDLTTQSGLYVRLREEIRASLPKDPDRRAAAFKWLEDNGHGGLIKHQFVISFGKGEEKWAKKFEADLRKRKQALDLKRKDDVHNQTLCAFLREQRAEGVDVPLQAFGAFVQTFAQVERED